MVLLLGVYCSRHIHAKWYSERASLFLVMYDEVKP